MALRTPVYSIVLAAGKGRRMRTRDKHKVCFEIAGVPAIVRALDTYNRLGIAQNVIVVGDLAGQVLETVGQKFSNVVFAYQAHALGTGDAAACGLQALESVPGDARILVTAGDKLIESSLLSRLIDEYDRWQAGLCILASPAELGGESAGRILLDCNGRPAAIAELADIRLRACRVEIIQMLEQSSADRINAEDLLPRVQKHAGAKVTLQGVLGMSAVADDQSWERGQLLQQLRSLPIDFPVDSTGERISAIDAERSPLRNESIYLIRKDLLEEGLRHMPTDNAQGELYLTDAVGAVLSGIVPAQAERPVIVGYVRADRPNEVMSYNNPEELLQIEDHFHGQHRLSLEEIGRRLGHERVRTADEWLEIFADENAMSPEVATALGSYYGNDDQDLLKERFRSYQETLVSFRDLFGGDRPLILVRSPGRINIMGRHIDWQGGHCNLMAVNQEVIMAAAPRNDDHIELRNLEPTVFPDASLSIGRLTSRLNWDDWLSCVNSHELEHHLRQSAGNWSLYVEAAMLRLQMAFRDRLLRGMDVVVSGSIPVAAGMSSSSALVVSTAETAVALHGLDVRPRQFVNFCGEGEWFVGTRGGSADHAAMKFGSAGMITHVKFHEFDVLKQITFPASHRLVVCNSFMQAKKAAGAKQAFNSRVASYLLGVELVRLQNPQFAPVVQYVRDISAENLRVPIAAVYEILLQLPEALTAAEVKSLFARKPESWQNLSRFFDGVDPETSYPVRGVMLFGIAECARARQAADCLERGELAELGALMKISHDGERCFQVTDELQAVGWSADISDDYLHGLIRQLQSNDDNLIRGAQLSLQPGAYRCSTQEIDAIVDIACRTPGVEGAQIAGAGLGGCAMVLVRKEAVGDLRNRLEQKFYGPKGLASGVNECIPAAGSCLVAIPQPV